MHLRAEPGTPRSASPAASRLPLDCVGRLEVQVEISLPDEHGRHQILSIHTAKMRENKYLSPDVSLEELAAETKNFSGAEIEGLVRSATSWAFGREVTVENVKKGAKAENLLVTRPDFDRALAGPPPCSRGVGTAPLHTPSLYTGGAAARLRLP